MRFLVVDDNEIIRRSLIRVIESHGEAECAEAIDGKEAVEKSLNWKPDLILLDVRLPELSGFEAARIIKKNQPDIRILFCSIYDTPDVMQEAKLIGDGFLLKEEIVETLPHAIGAVARKEQFFPADSQPEPGT